MPYDEVMPKFKQGKLHSGSKKGPTVTNRKQAIAIMLSEKREANKGKKEYKPKKYQDGGPVSSMDTDIPLPSLQKGETGPQSPTVPEMPLPRPAPFQDTKPRYEPEYRGSKVVAVRKGGAITKHSDGGWRRW
jgi:hypothetical protein